MDNIWQYIEVKRSLYFHEQNGHAVLNTDPTGGTRIPPGTYRFSHVSQGHESLGSTIPKLMIRKSELRQLANDGIVRVKSVHKANDLWNLASLFPD